MFYFLLIIAIILPNYSSKIINKNSKEFSVVSYLPEWRYEGANFNTICKHSTHLIFFSIEPGEDGNIIGLDRFPKDYVLLPAIKASKEYGCKLLICFGGNGRSTHFSTITRNNKLRKKFIKNVYKLIEKYNLDGVDYNWEYPGHSFQNGYASKEEIKNDYVGLIKLLQDTRKKFDSFDKKKIITIAYYPDKRQETLLLAGKADEYCDLMHMMTYDQKGGHHSTYNFAIESIQQGFNIGLNSTRLTLGVPFYGRDSVTGDWTTYEDIVQNNHPLLTDIDEVKSRNGFIGFNNIKTIENKVRYSYKSNLGGIMIWEVGKQKLF